MSKRLSDKQRREIALARIREQAIKKRNKRIGLNASGNCSTQLQGLIPLLQQGKRERKNTRFKPYNKGIGCTGLLAYGVRKGLLGITDSNSSKLRKKGVKNV